MWHGIKLGIFILALVTVFSFAVHSDFSSASPTVTKPNKQYQVDKEVEVPAKAYVIFDAKTGAVLGKKNVNEVVPIASVTKLFTAAALNERDLSASSTVTWADVAAEEDFGKLEAGHEYQLRELLFPLLIESSNDAAAHLERVTSGGVLHDMNSLAKQVGLPDTYLYDASGLSVKNVSTATDLARF